ncbi:MAG: PorV/PorQ family protein [Elusimicrobia bacterium]|nr:PorV/PorQ family protein [Elusimicrobiota bacterium]
MRLPLLALILAFAPLSGASAGSPGSTGAEFLKFGQGARAIGMGESHAAVADDAYAAYWNPAGLASLVYPTVSTTYNRALQGVDQQYLSFAYPLRSGSTLDLNVTRLGMSNLQGYDAQGTKTREVGASDYAVGIAVGQTLVRDDRGRARVNAGLNGKMIREQLDRVTASTFAGDVGVLAYVYRSRASATAGPDPGLRLGLVARNLGPGLKFDREAAPLPTTYTAGLAWRAYPRGDALTLSADVAVPRDDSARPSFGLEYTAFRVVALRMGYLLGQDTGVGFRAGVGFRLKVVEIDYAFAGFGDIGQMHRVGLSVRLGGPVDPTPPEERLVKEAMDKGQRLLKEGRAYEAALQFDEELRLDPGNRQALEFMRQAHDALKK